MTTACPYNSRNSLRYCSSLAPFFWSGVSKITIKKNKRKLRLYPQQLQRFIFTNLSEACCEAKRWKYAKAEMVVVSVLGSHKLLTPLDGQLPQSGTFFLP